jgi:twitching motility protein PilT
VAQQLLPRADGEGRVAAVEILIANPAIRDCLKDPARVVEIRQMMAEDATRSGMQTFSQHIEELAAGGIISAETAKAVTGAPERKGKRKGSDN